jgi:AcrR family transcriptional regulator
LKRNSRVPHHGKAGEDGATAARLLEAAAHEFARHGFAAARVRDIVEAAGANLAAVNYHFGGKEGLYQATLAHLGRRARDESPFDSPALRAMPPEDQLRAFARVMLMRYMGAAQPLPLSRIVAHELLDPTPAFARIVEGLSRPHWARLLEIVRALLGPRASEEDVSLAGLSAASQWTFFLFGRRMFESVFPALAGEPGLVDRLAEHIAFSSIAAMRATRARLEAKPADPRPSRRPSPAEGVKARGRAKKEVKGSRP